MWGASAGRTPPLDKRRNGNGGALDRSETEAAQVFRTEVFAAAVFHARQFRNPRAPSLEDGALLRNGDAGDVREQESRIDRDVRHRELLAGHKRLGLQHIVEILHTAHGPVTLPDAPFLAAGPFRTLVGLELNSKARCGMVEINAHRVDEFGLRTFLHHVDHALLFGRPPGEGRISIEIIQIFSDSGAFGEVCAVIELKHRQHAGGILLEELAFLVLGTDQVDLHELDLGVESLLGQDDANARRIGSAGIIENFHWGALSVIYLSVDRYAELGLPLADVKAYL